MNEGISNLLYDCRECGKNIYRNIYESYITYYRAWILPFKHINIMVFEFLLNFQTNALFYLSLGYHFQALRTTSMSCVMGLDDKLLLKFLTQLVFTLILHEIKCFFLWTFYPNTYISPKSKT